ncbi:FtsX-like permease family protein [Streptococcus sp. zg-JUN1979]|uniref:FtsX-like permease family protein n=1 Tax=Streptococcus sp. zg-JUN1979 TaxID=3391450 RepID=UPI0039A518DA
MFYLKLAWNNVKKSLSTYAPFLLASLLLYSLTCSTLLILLNPLAADMGVGTTPVALGVVVLIIFSIIMERYSYRILLKQRSREFGLYNILGMTKKQVAIIATYELGLIFIALSLLGALFSAVFAKFIYLIFVNVTHYHDLNLQLIPLPFLINTVIFASIFIVLWLTALAHIKRTSPLALFRHKEKGEKEPRGNVLMALLSVIAIAIAYYLSISADSQGALAVVYRFFIAVLLVILGTYLFYISFMAWYLKRLRANKAYYYQPNHFISVSQMIFRMKQNAAGLASISLLSVMALVTIGTTASLYSNSQNMANQLFIKNTQVSYYPDSLENGDTPDELFQKEVLDKVGKTKNDSIRYNWMMAPISLTKDAKGTSVSEDTFANLNPNTVMFLYIVTQDEFKQLGNSIETLNDNQALLWAPKRAPQLDSIDFFGTRYDVISHLTQATFPNAVNTIDAGILVLANQKEVDKIYQSYVAYQDQGYGVTRGYEAFIDLTSSQVARISDEKASDNQKEKQGIITTRDEMMSNLYQLFGGLLFTGFLLGFSFLLGIALIIYYKQYAEGHEDQKAYRILQEVGMSQKQVKQTINSQVILFFFMPLGIATLHYIFALPSLKEMLLLFGVTDSGLVYIVSAVTVAVISLIYYFIYRFTSRVYYTIIER